VRSSFAFLVSPEERTDSVATAFVQDEITLVPDALRFTAGCKLEHNDYSEFEFQPSTRLAWEVDERQTLWGAVSRAVRTPSIVDVDVRLTPIIAPGPLPIAFQIFGSDDFRSEELIAYEAGYRVRPADAVSFDLALFYNDYDHLRSGTPGAPFPETSPVPHIVVPINLGNNLTAEAYGGELAVNLQATRDWLLQAHYGYLELDLSSASEEGRDPRHTAMLRSSLQLFESLSVDVTTRYVSELTGLGVDEYVEAGVRAAWRDPSGRFEAAIVGHDLVHEEHAEFGTAGQRSEIQRGVFAVLTWTF
jgi:iron complex outermembrane recepter protein